MIFFPQDRPTFWHEQHTNYRSICKICIQNVSHTVTLFSSYPLFLSHPHKIGMQSWPQYVIFFGRGWGALDMIVPLYDRCYARETGESITRYKTMVNQSIHSPADEPLTCHSLFCCAFPLVLDTLATFARGIVRVVALGHWFCPPLLTVTASCEHEDKESNLVIT